jgi:hypothetical protein
MTSSPFAADPDAAWATVDACTLPSAERPLRLAEFDDLFATSLRDVSYPAEGSTRARLVLAGDDALPGRVRRLADAETSCCSFFTFTLTAVPGGDGATLALDVEVPAAHADVLAGLVARAERARGAAA